MHVADFAQRLKNVADEPKTFGKFPGAADTHWVFRANETNVDARNSALPRHLLSSLAEIAEQEPANVMYVADFAYVLYFAADEPKTFSG